MFFVFLLLQIFYFYKVGTRRIGTQRNPSPSQPSVRNINMDRFGTNNVRRQSARIFVIPPQPPVIVDSPGAYRIEGSRPARPVTPEARAELMPIALAVPISFADQMLDFYRGRRRFQPEAVAEDPDLTNFDNLEWSD